MSDAPPIEPKDNAAAFRLVADKIDLNKTNGFGGAFVIVTPDGVVMDLLLLDNSQNPAMFLGLVKTRAEIALAEMEADSRQDNMGFGRRR